jgi:hypothetical protein
MINVPTHKRHKSPFKHSKTIYIFTSGRVIPIQIHSRKKMIYAIVLQDLMKMGVCRCGVEMLLLISNVWAEPRLGGL